VRSASGHHLHQKISDWADSRPDIASLRAGRTIINAQFCAVSVRPRLRSTYGRCASQHLRPDLLSGGCSSSRICCSNWLTALSTHCRHFRRHQFFLSVEENSGSGTFTTTRSDLRGYLPVTLTSFHLMCRIGSIDHHDGRQLHLETGRCVRHSAGNIVR